MSLQIVKESQFWLEMSADFVGQSVGKNAVESEGTRPAEAEGKRLKMKIPVSAVGEDTQAVALLLDGVVGSLLV